jgi:hypothetical protein
LKQNKKEILKKLRELHQTWKQSKKTLKWWKNETGYVGINIRILCKIPIPHPEPIVQIGCLYLIHLDYMYQTICEPAILKYRTDVCDFLKKIATKYDLPNTDDGLFPW